MSAIFGIGAGIGLPLSGVIADGLGLAVAVLDQPDRAARRARRAPLVPPSPASRRTTHRLDRRGAPLRGARGHPARGDRGQRLGLGLAARRSALIAGGVGAVRRLARGSSRASQQPLIDLRCCAGARWRPPTSPGCWSGFAMFSSFLLIPQFAQAPESTGYGFGDSRHAGRPAAGARRHRPAGGRPARRRPRRSDRLPHHARDRARAWPRRRSSSWRSSTRTRGSSSSSAALLGAGISFAFASMANLIVGAVPQSEVGIATGINTVMRTVGGAFGAAVATAILTGNTHRRERRCPPRAPTPRRSCSPRSAACSRSARRCCVPTRAAERARAACRGRARRLALPT